MGTRPLVRWWWLRGPFTAADITRQLEWFTAHGFGGVELAWLHPAWLPPTDDEQRPAFLGPDFQRLLGWTKAEGDRLGLRVDATFGSCWPFGGTWVTEIDAAKTLDGPSSERLQGSWEEPATPPVLDHLSAPAMARYAAALAPAFAPVLAGHPSALFCDSLELGVDRIWTPALDAVFEERFGYDLASADLEDPRVRYDHLATVSEAFQEGFVEPFVEAAHQLGAEARMQCHGAPADLVRAYATVDVPESEVLLFEPTHSRIAASAAALAGRRMVTCETFTCTYGFVGRPDLTPLRYWHAERFDDLRLVADAAFANGVNRIVWHGAPYQPEGRAPEFFASVHVAPDGALSGPELTAFNRYLAQASALLQRGRPHTDVAVLLGVEDGFMAGRIPVADRTPGAAWHFEHRRSVPHAALAGHQPMWITGPFLGAARVEDGRVVAGHASFSALVVDVAWLEAEVLARIVDLAAAGGAVVLGRTPRQPGTRMVAGYDDLVARLRSLAAPSVAATGAVPLLAGPALPPYWARRVDDGVVVFLAHPACADVTFPLRHGQAEEATATSRDLTITVDGVAADIRVRFPAGRSVALHARGDGRVEELELDG